MAAPQADART